MVATLMLQAWDVLAENFKLANRGQANDIGMKLRKIGATVAPRLGAAESFEFTLAEVETLAEHEHVRWCAERTTAGWTYARRYFGLLKGCTCRPSQTSPAIRHM